jgi:hypothetical protein
LDIANCNGGFYVFFIQLIEKGGDVESIEPDLLSEKGGRRTGIERREFSFTAFAPERRRNNDRRRNPERREKNRIANCWKDEASPAQGLMQE